MSVINKMLRDLDRRQADGATPVQSWESRTGMTRDASKMDYSVGADRKQNSTSFAVLMAVLLTALVFSAAAGGWWYLSQNQSTQRPVDQAKQVSIPVPSVAVAAVAVAPASIPPAPILPVVVAALAPATVQPVAVAPIAPTTAPAAVVPAAPAIPINSKPAVVVTPEPAPSPVQPKAVVVAAPAIPGKIVPPSATQSIAPALPAAAAKLPKTESVAPTDAPLKIDRPVPMASKPTVASSPAVAAPARPVVERPANGAPTAAAAVSEAPTNTSRPSPATEALAQAQSLWNSGAHQEAIGLAREALVTAERTNLASPSAGNKSMLASLARELARMEMAQGRVREALEMLTRLEPVLFANADVWAMRGNAAQRLGRHAESVAAYVMALRLRPNEARWMLAAAISLANQGQMADAAELTERARVGGVLTPEVTAYLKQLGVPMRER